jgi:hypothetical protein
MADQFYAVGSSSPFFNLLSLNGDVQVSRGYPLGQSPQNLDINEVKYYQGNIYFSSRGPFGLNTYVHDMNLNLSSAVGTVAGPNGLAYRGGISLFDSVQNSLYYVLNFGGGSTSQSNGFEIMRSGPTGKSCDVSYAGSATPLLLDNRQVTVKSDTVAMHGVLPGPAPVFTPLAWRSYQVTIAATENICGH